MTKEIDWLAVEADYRPGILSNREIATKHGCTEGGVRKKAKQKGWIKDLAAKIESKAEDIVRREAVRAEYAEATEADIVNANAVNNANIQIAERKDVTKARSIAMKLLDELNDQIDNRSDLEDLGEMMRNPDAYGNDKLNDQYMRAISFAGRVDSTKKLSESLNTLINLERKVYKIDTDPFSDVDKKARVILSFE
jgi:hypothetical protein